MTQLNGASRTVPTGFFGTHPDRHALNSLANMKSEFGAMRAAGVERLRLTFYWQAIQHYFAPPSYDDSAGNDFLKTDIVVEQAVRHGFQILGVIWSTPAWACAAGGTGFASNDTLSALTIFGGVPGDPQDFAEFMALLVRRYGPDGSFWREHADLDYAPIREWQLWQEPDRPAFMPQPFDVPTFVALAHAGYRAVKSADPGATVLLAGLGPDCGRSTDLLRSLYESGIKGAFDVAALHPFPHTAQEVMDAVRMNRKVMEAYGDGQLPVALSQVTFLSCEGESRGAADLPPAHTAMGQAREVGEVLRLAAEYREELNLWGVLWHGWCSVDAEPSAPNQPDPWLWSGLRRMEPNGKFFSKPSFFAYARAALMLEGRSQELAGWFDA